MALVRDTPMDRQRMKENIVRFRIIFSQSEINVHIEISRYCNLGKDRNANFYEIVKSSTLVH